MGGLFNPLGLFYVIASALPSTLGANTGLLPLPAMVNQQNADREPAPPLQRSLAWIAAGAIACVLFIFVLGRGITWQR
jgi:hypothetical protein